MIDQTALMQIVEEHRGDAFVVPTMMGNGAWQRVSKTIERDVPISGAMGKASSFALGLALAHPQSKVIVFDGDGSLLMNLGSLVTIAEQAPRNLYHFVLENGVYAMTGGQPIPGKSRVSFAGLAREAGYARSYEFDDLEDFASQAKDLLDQQGPVFVCAKIVPEIRNRPVDAIQPATKRSTKQAIQELRRRLEAL